MMKRTPAQQHLLEQIKQVADGLGRTLAPFTEVVLHDLLDPGHAVLAIHNNLSGRAVGEPATELGLARIADPSFPQVLANYPNTFPDGRPAKSTSVGIKDQDGQYIAALCLNVDLNLFRSLQAMLGQFSNVDPAAAVIESLAPAAGADAIRAHIEQFAARLSTTPRALKADDRRALLRELGDAGLLDMRRSMETIAAHLGVSRATVYNYAK
ncbi:transcriptional regulator [Pseudoduganella eburnea]|uniref:Transcriptional regulator n=1 Tax=Massilia eburnea TaxID=1776165 RepID=A0A6L6QFG2_9BURK|nr:PAS domain-containing protein [Massilia eburnea]MTW10959.1 transcriptional regulator [Massilia eburnea]